MPNLRDRSVLHCIALHSVAHNYLLCTVYALRCVVTQKRALDVNKCKQRPKVWSVVFHFFQISLENDDLHCIWHCIKTPILFVKQISVWTSETKAFVTKTVLNLNDGKCVFYIGDFTLFNLELFLQFSSNLKTIMENLNSYINNVESI